MVEADGATRSALMRISSPDVKSRRHKPARPGKELSLSSSIPDRCSQSAVSFDFTRAPFCWHGHSELPVERQGNPKPVGIFGELGYVVHAELPFAVLDFPDHLQDPVVQRDRDSVLPRLHGDGYVLGFALPFPVDDVPMDAAGLLYVLVATGGRCPLVAAQVLGQ